MTDPRARRMSSPPRTKVCLGRRVAAHTSDHEVSLTMETPAPGQLCARCKMLGVETKTVVILGHDYKVQGRLCERRLQVIHRACQGPGSPAFLQGCPSRRSIRGAPAYLALTYPPCCKQGFDSNPEAPHPRLCTP